MLWLRRKKLFAERPQSRRHFVIYGFDDL